LRGTKKFRRSCRFAFQPFDYAVKEPPNPLSWYDLLPMDDAKPISVQLATALRHEWGGGSVELSIHAKTVAEALDQLRQEHPALYRCICDETGAVRRHIHLFVDQTLVRQGEGFHRRLAPGNVLFIMTAVSGG